VSNKEGDYCIGAPYEMFAGRDASRGLATMSTSCLSDQYDSLSDLTEAQQESLAHWEKQFAGILGASFSPA